MSLNFSSSKSKEATKPKRWRTFKNAFGKNRHKKSQENIIAPTTPTKKGTIFGRLKRKTSGATMRQVNTDTNLHSNRPLSLIEDSMPMDHLEQLLDAQPSHSLPATPLARRRSNPMLFPQLEQKLAIDPTMTLPSKLPSLTVSAPNEDSDNESEGKLPATDLIRPPSGFRDNSSNEVSTRESRSCEVASLDAKTADDNDEMPKNGTPVNVEVPTLQAAVNVIADKKVHVIKDQAWEEIRAILTESNETGSKIEPSLINSDVYNKDEPWRNMPSGIEGLRAFLDMSD